MPDIITDSMNSQFLGIPTILWIVVLLVGIIVIYKRKPKQKEFKEINAEQETKRKYKELIALTGQKINKKLLYGIVSFGQVGRCAEKGDSVLFEFYSNPLAIVKRRLKLFRKYVIIPNDAIITHAKEIEIKPIYQYDNIEGVLAFGKAKDKVIDESYKITHESAINSMVNWLKLQTYLSVNHAQGSEALDHIAEIEKAKRSEAINEMTGKNKK